MSRELKKTDCYGVMLTGLQNMEFSIYLKNNSFPAMNTISREERKQIVFDWLKSQQL